MVQRIRGLLFKLSAFQRRWKGKRKRSVSAEHCYKSFSLNGSGEAKDSVFQGNPLPSPQNKVIAHF